MVFCLFNMFVRNKLIWILVCFLIWKLYHMKPPKTTTTATFRHPVPFLSYLSLFKVCFLQRKAVQQCFSLIDWFCQTPISTVQWRGLGEEDNMCVCHYVCMLSILLRFSPLSQPLPGMLVRPPKEARIFREGHNYNQSERQSHSRDKLE